MLKKVISTMLSLCLILCISVAAENIDAVSEAAIDGTAKYMNKSQLISYSVRLQTTGTLLQAS